VFISHGEDLSAARAELQSAVFDLLPRLRVLTRCIDCDVVDSGIEFRAGGVAEIPIAQTWLRSTMRLQLSSDSTGGVTYEVIPQIARTFVFYRGRLTPEFRRLQVPVIAPSLLRLSASTSVSVRFDFFDTYTEREGFNTSLMMPFPEHFTSDILTAWRAPSLHQRLIATFTFRSTNGAAASVTYRENNGDIATFSTTSTSFTNFSLTRLLGRFFYVSYSASPNAEVAQVEFALHTEPVTPSMLSASASYSTTSTTYVKYTPISLIGMRAAVRRVVVDASPNAKFYVAFDDVKVLDSDWNVREVTFSPPSAPTRVVDLYLASTDGTNATATIAVIYEILARI